jgi:flagellar hook-associated protein 1 FlgK
MSKIWSMVDVGKRSMLNSQAGLQTVSHNIANKSTEGYSRQRTEQVTNPPTGIGQITVGTGARLTGVTRTNNPHLEKQLEQEGSELGQMKAQSEAMARVEQVYNEQVNKGLNKFMGEFFNSFRELSNNPESAATRTLVKESADFLAKDFHRVDGQLRQIQGDIDFQIRSLVNDINEFTAEIAELNEKIQIVEGGGGQANDQRDRRDLLIKKLSEKVNIRWAESKSGQVSITAGSTAVLVSGFSSMKLSVRAGSSTARKDEGLVDILYHPTETSRPVAVTDQFKGGSIGGLLAVRDDTIRNLRDGMDEMAFTFAKEVNRAHTRGFDRYNKNGLNFFEVPKESKNASSMIKVNSDIMMDVGKIAAGAAPNSPGDNRIANIISSLQYQKRMDGNGATFDDFYGSMVGQVGIETSRVNNGLVSQQGIVEQLTNLRESISGVSLDEETTKLIEYQKQFDASARLIRAADEMLDTVLNIKRY